MKAKEKNSGKNDLRSILALLCCLMILIWGNNVISPENTLYPVVLWLKWIASAAFFAALLISAVRRNDKDGKQEKSGVCKEEPAKKAVSEEKNTIEIRYADCRPIDRLDPEQNSGVPYDIRMAMVIARFLTKRDYAMVKTVIGGGATEISHTGAVEYGASYTSAECFLANAKKNYLEAEKEAQREYGSWFTGLNYSFIRHRYEKDGAALKIMEIPFRLTIIWEEGCEEAARELEAALRMSNECFHNGF